MNTEIKLSVIIPAYNPGKKIISSLNSLGKNLKYFSKFYDLIYEVLVINDGGDEINLGFDHNINNIFQFKVRKNKGVGYIRQLGAKIAKYNFILYLDSDIVMEKENTIQTLFQEYRRLKNVGSIGPVQSYKNLNEEFTSNFVAAKTCYGFEGKNTEVEFSGIRSECCLIEKKFLKLVGGWKFFPGAGGEEFELGHRIIKKGKINYITKKTNYTTYYENLLSRSKEIILRTSAYIPIFINRKRFETKGAFATSQQAISVFITSLTLLFLGLHFFYDTSLNFIFIFIILNFYTEFDFLKFTLAYYKKKDFLVYVLGIYVINISIIIGTILGILKLYGHKNIRQTYKINKIKY